MKYSCDRQVSLIQLPVTAISTLKVALRSGVVDLDVAATMAKAYGALSMGMPTSQMRDRFKTRPAFQTALTGIGNRVDKGWVAVPGGVCWSWMRRATWRVPWASAVTRATRMR